MGGLSRADAAPLVSVCHCPSYDPSDVSRAVDSVLEPLGDMGAFVSPGERIGLKPNLLMAVAPEQAITTHPAVLEAVAARLLAAGASPVIVESPGAALANSARALRHVFERTGAWEVAERLGLEVCMENTGTNVSNPSGRLLKRLDVLTGALEVDGLVSVCKLKTHTFMTFTGAVKNLFGLIAGMSKGGYHARLADPLHFADMLLDVAGFAPPRLSLMDAVLALEGDGPGTGGRPRFVGAVLASTDPVALDTVACRLAGIDPARVPVLMQAAKRGLPGADAAAVRVVGDDVEDLYKGAFLLPAQREGDRLGFGAFSALQRVLLPLARGALNPRPRPKTGRCIACRACERACPKGAISVVDGLARVDDSLCIRCFCCHELCPVAAIDLEFVGAARVARALRMV
jgi:uncharacterized protein (DUF362 family)/Pyruvate/2-oxoacid:ferredoxin oxidoreductase delta subunit